MRATVARSLNPLRSAVAAWFGVALLVRLATLLSVGAGLPCAFDECSYLRLGQALAAGDGWLTEKGFLWPPGYPLFLSWLVPEAGASSPVARGVQAVLGALLVWPVARLAHAVHPGARGVALHLPLAFVALYPTLVAYSHLLWPETLFLLLFTTAVSRAAAASGGRWALLSAGLLFGAAGLFKSVGLWLGLLCAGARLSGGEGRRHRVAAAAWLVLGCVLAVAPWTARNAAAYGKFLLLDATTGTNLFLGNTDAPPVCWDWNARDRWRVWYPERERCEEGDFIARDRCERRRAAAWIGRNPGRFATRALTKWADLVAPTSFLVKMVRSGRYGGTSLDDVPPLWAAAATVAAGAPWLALALLAAWGLACAPPSTRRRLTLAVIIGLLGVTALTFGMSRFRLPVVPLLAAWTGLGWARLSAGPRLPATRPARVALAAAVTALVILWGLRAASLFPFTPEI